MADFGGPEAIIQGLQAGRIREADQGHERIDVTIRIANQSLPAPIETTLSTGLAMRSMSSVSLSKAMRCSSEKLESAVVTLDKIIRASENSEAGYDALLSVMTIVNAMGGPGRRFEESALANYLLRMKSSKGGKNGGGKKRKEDAAKWQPAALDIARNYIVENQRY
jgi:hypothetical protein